MFWASQEVPTKLEAPPDGAFGPQMLHSIAQRDAWGPCGVWDQTPVTYMQGMCLSPFTSFLAPPSFSSSELSPVILCHLGNWVLGVTSFTGFQSNFLIVWF